MLERLTEESKDLRTTLETVTQERNEMYRTVDALTGTMKSQLDLQDAQIGQSTNKMSKLRKAMQRAGYERRSPEAS